MPKRASKSITYYGYTVSSMPPREAHWPEQLRLIIPARIADSANQSDEK
jgi:hypothetical protein